ncbi:MAG: hypothetical protein R3F55_13020 [Alphaproteobacteria bacterium]
MHQRHGTRVRLFPIPPYAEPDLVPDTVTLRPPSGSVGPGPCDDRILALSPIGKIAPYGFVGGGPAGSRLSLPPWTGPVGFGVVPDGDGHLDRIPVDSPDFPLVHAYGTARFVLDIWEDYFGRTIPWHFADSIDRLEVSLFEDWDNAQAGYGFLELGAHRDEDGGRRPFALNFDIVAHELGHLIVYQEVGLPELDVANDEFFGFHESAADMAALVALLHFDSVLDRLMARTRGNLYALNELNRFGELSNSAQIRLASNDVRMTAFVDGWDDEHLLAQPLTGALFDLLVDIFHRELRDRGLIPRQLAEMADGITGMPHMADEIQAWFDRLYPVDPAGFRSALTETRDLVGRYLALVWEWLECNCIGYSDVEQAVIEADAVLTGGRYRKSIGENFAWRRIGDVPLGPRRGKTFSQSHATSARTLTPDDGAIVAKRPLHCRRRHVSIRGVKGGIARLR